MLKNLKISWISFIVSIIILVPFQIYCAIFQSEWNNSQFFNFMVTLFFVVYELTVLFTKDFKQKFQIKKNIFLCLICILIFLDFNLCAFFYTGQTNLYATEYSEILQPIGMAILSMLTSISFLIIGICHLLGKNIYKKLQVVVFLPAIWYVVVLINYSSASLDIKSIYDISTKSLILLFLVYFTHSFINFSNNKTSNKRIFYFGLPAIVSCLMYDLPKLILIQQFDSSNLINLYHFILNISICLYILIFSIVYQMQNHQEPKVVEQ